MALFRGSGATNSSTVADDVTSAPGQRPRGTEVLYEAPTTDTVDPLVGNVGVGAAAGMVPTYADMGLGRVGNRAGRGHGKATKRSPQAVLQHRRGLPVVSAVVAPCGGWDRVGQHSTGQDTTKYNKMHRIE